MSPLLWPYQPCPGPTSFWVWRRLLATAFWKGNRRSVSARTIDLSLRCPLGRWLWTSTAFRCQWPSFYSASSDELFLASEAGATFTCHKARKIRRRPKNSVRAFSEEPATEVTTLPVDVVPVDCSAEPHKIVIPVAVPCLAPPPDPPPHPYAATWIEYVHTLPGWEQGLLSSVSFVDRRGLLIVMRSNDCIFLASDGGAADRSASFGAVLATHDTILLECGGRAQGANPWVFRAEGYGILAILRLSFHVRTFYVTQNPNLRFKLYCDSESILKRIAASPSLKRLIPCRFLFSEADVEMQIVASLHALVAHVAFEHVEGHQDTKYPYEPLSWAAHLNQRCDAIATEHLKLVADCIPTVPFLLASRVTVSVGRYTITHHLPTQFRNFTGLPDIQAHHCTHHTWSGPAIFDLVDWPVFHSASLATTFLKRLFGIKMINLLLPLQKQQYRFGQTPSASCLSACGCPEEDWTHFLRCPHLQHKQAWTAFVPTLSSTMERWQLDPSLRRILLHLIAPLTTLPPIPLTDLADEYGMLLTTQRSI
jgi:hypothetical protein